MLVIASCAVFAYACSSEDEPSPSGADASGGADAGGDAGASCGWGPGTFGHTLQVAHRPGEPSVETSTSVDADGEIREWFPMLRIDLDDGREVRGYLSLGGAMLPPAPTDTRARVELAIDGTRFWRASVFTARVDGVVYGVWRSVGTPVRIEDLTLTEQSVGCTISEASTCEVDVTPIAVQATRAGETRTVGAGESAEAATFMIVNGHSFAAPSGTQACLSDAPPRQAEGMVVLR